MAFAYSLPLRVAQGLLAVIILGLMAYGELQSSSQSSIGMIITFLLPSCQRLDVLELGSSISKLPSFLQCLDYPRTGLPCPCPTTLPNRCAQVRDSCGWISYHALLVRWLHCGCRTFDRHWVWKILGSLSCFGGCYSVRSFWVVCILYG